MAAPPALALSVPIADSTREWVDLHGKDAATALMLPSEDTMLELRAHDEPELQVNTPAVRPMSAGSWASATYKIVHSGGVPASFA